VDTFSEEFNIKYYEVDGNKVETVEGRLAEAVRLGKVTEIKAFF